MAKKPKTLAKIKPLDHYLAQQWCYYCGKEFQDIKVLVTHQKQKHFTCTVHGCNRHLNTAGGLSVHLEQVHKERLTSVPNAIEGREDPNVEVFGMEGVPQYLIDEWRNNTIKLYKLQEEEYRRETGNPLPGSGVAHVQKVRVKETKEELRARVKAFAEAKKAKKAAEEAAKAAGMSDSTTGDAMEGVIGQGAPTYPQPAPDGFSYPSMPQFPLPDFSTMPQFNNSAPAYDMYGATSGFSMPPAYSTAPQFGMQAPTQFFPPGFLPPGSLPPSSNGFPAPMMPVSSPLGPSSYGQPYGYPPMPSSSPFVPPFSNGFAPPPMPAQASPFPGLPNRPTPPGQYSSYPTPSAKPEPGVSIKPEPGVSIKSKPDVAIKREPSVAIKQESGLPTAESVNDMIERAWEDARNRSAPSPTVSVPAVPESAISKKTSGKPAKTAKKQSKPAKLTLTGDISWEERKAMAPRYKSAT